MIIERFNIFKKKEKYVLILHRPIEQIYLILLLCRHGLEDFITVKNINDIDINIDNISYFDSIDAANKRLDFVIHKYHDNEWTNRENWKIMKFEDIDLLLATNKFNL